MRSLAEAIVVNRALWRLRRSIATNGVHDRGSYVEVWFNSHVYVDHKTFIEQHSRLMLSVKGSRSRVSLKSLEQFADFCDALDVLVRAS